MSPPRRAAYDLLHDVAVKDSYANLAMPAILDARGVRGRDAALATELAYSTLRWRGFLDAALALCVDRPLDELDPRVLDVLRLGAAQVLLMRIPSHAAVSESVTLTREVGATNATGLVNAVLRRLASDGLEDWRARVREGQPTVTDALAAEWSHPRWIVSALRDALGDPAEIEALLAADNEPARVTLVARTCDRDELLAVPGAEPGRWSPRAVTVQGIRPSDIAAVRDGRAGVQDEGSQLIALALAALPLEGDDARWLDMCAGPGGKAALLGALAAERGARVVALEPLTHRAGLVRRAVRGLPVEVREADGRTPTEGGFDRVLVDVPCTGLGVLRRRPEARWRRSPADVGRLAALQRELLAAGIAAARPGGVILYSTCSPHLAETELVVADSMMPSVERLPLALVPGEPPAESARLWPHRHGTDGMFAAALRRLA